MMAVLGLMEAYYQVILTGMAAGVGIPQTVQNYKCARKRHRR